MSVTPPSAPALLYVDDERNNRLVLMHALGADLPLLLAASADEALALLDHERVDVLLADHRMPGMTGVQLATLVRERHPHVRRWLMTAYPDDQEVAGALEAGVVHRLLQKPWDRDVLLGALFGLKSA